MPKTEMQTEVWHPVNFINYATYYKSHSKVNEVNYSETKISMPNLKVSKLIANSCTHRRRDATRQLSRVGGVYWVLYS